MTLMAMMAYDCYGASNNGADGDAAEVEKDSDGNGGAGGGDVMIMVLMTLMVMPNRLRTSFTTRRLIVGPCATKSHVYTIVDQYTHIVHNQRITKCTPHADPIQSWNIMGAFGHIVGTT